MKLKKPNKIYRTILYILFVSLLVIPSIVGVGITFFRLYSREKTHNDTKITGITSIESLEKITLGDVEQWILIRGEDRSNPVLLWLHGGPGRPTLPLATKHDSELIKHFVVVHWDQRGAGKSFSPEIPTSSMIMDQFVSDTIELTQILNERFNKQKLFLIGHSWGSKVGVLTVNQYPDLFHAFIGLGQSVYSADGDSIGFQFALDRASSEDNQKAIRQLEEIGPPPWTTSKQRSIYSRWINKFGGTGINFTIQDYYREIINSPNYSLQDILNFFQGQQFTGKTVIKKGESERVNLFEQAIQLKIPIYFFSGSA